MSTLARFTLGEGVRVRLEFRDPETRELADPEVPVIVTVDPPAPGATRTIEAVRIEEGVFTAMTAGDAVGRWSARGRSSGLPAERGVWEGSFEVVASRMR